MNVKQIISITMLFLMITLAGLANAGSDHPVYKSKRSGVAIKGYDTVAYFTENAAVKGDKALSYEWHDAIWRFSSEKNLALFKENPEKYAPQYGGWCAYAMSDARTVKIDPEAFEVYNDKLYLNYSKSVLGHWKKDKDLFITEADGHYPNVVDLALLEK